MYAAMYKKMCPIAATTCKKINIYDNPAFIPLPNTEEVPVIDLFYYSTKPCDVYSQVPMYHQPYYNGYPTAGMPVTGMPVSNPYMPSNPYMQSYTAPPQQSYSAPPPHPPPPPHPHPPPSSYYTGGGCKSCATK